MNGPDREKEFMRLYGRLSDRELARYFGVPVSQIELMVEAVRKRTAEAAQRAEEKQRRRAEQKRPRWTEAQIKTLLELYPHMPNTQVAEAVGRPVVSVVAKAHRMGIKKTPERLRQMGRENVGIRWNPVQDDET